MLSKFLLLSLSLFLIVGCGGSSESGGNTSTNSENVTDSSSSENIDGVGGDVEVESPDLADVPIIDTGIDTGFKIDESLSPIQPELMQDTLVDGMPVNLNTRMYGTIENGTELKFTFTSDVPGELMMFLRGEDASVNLHLKASRFRFSDDWEDTSFGASAALIFTYEQERTYYLTVYADSEYNGQQNFELVVVEPNRETLQLTENEYLIAVNIRIDRDCYDSVSGDDIRLVETPTRYSIANFTGGYVAITDKSSFYSYIYQGNNEFEEDAISSLTDRYVVDPTTGEISGTSRGTTLYYSEATTYSCDTTYTKDGQIVL